METLRQDIHFALRQFGRAPGLPLFIVATLAIAIGANTTVFSAVNRILLRALPYHEPEQLVAISGSYAGRGDDWSVSLPNAVDWGELNRSFTGVAYYANGSPTVTIAGSGEPRRLAAGVISPNLFSLLGAAPQLGRGFTAGDAEPGTEGRVVLSSGMWHSQFGGDPGVVGRTISLSGAPYTIIGVMPPGFGFPSPDQQLWMTIRANKNTWNRANGGLSVVARLKPGVTLAAAQRDMNAVSSVLASQYPDVDGSGNPSGALGAHLTSLHEALLASAGLQRMLWILLAAVCLVLLIACVNVANLLLARATAREREVALRTALGAGRLRMVRQLLTESLLLAGAGGIVGLVVAWVGTRALPGLIPEGVGLPDSYPIDLSVLGFTAGLTVLTGLVFGAGPALTAARGSTSTLLGGRGGHATPAREARRKALIVAEVALAAVLLASAGVVVRSLSELVHTNPGFQPEHLLTMRVALDRRYDDTVKVDNFTRQMLAAVRAEPSVQAASIADFLPMEGTQNFGNLSIEGDPDAGSVNVGNVIVGTDYFRTMSIPLRRGRGFDEHDTRSAPRAVVVNEAFAKHYFPGLDPLGRRVRSGGGDPWTIVGLSGDVRFSGLDAAPREEVYFPAGQFSYAMRDMAVAVRTRGDPMAAAGQVRKAIWSVDPDLAVYDQKPMPGLIGATTAMLIGRLLADGLGGFGILALLLASLGLYGVISYSVAQRTYEIGVRTALGADSGTVLRMVLAQGLKLVLGGLLLGLVASLASTRVLRSLVHGVGTADPVAFAAAGLLLVGVAAVASAIPALRAARIDPIVALRAE